MNGNKRVRQVHRWTSMVFTLAVVLSFVAVMGALPFWVVYLPLPPLALQLLTGLYLFVLHAVRWRGARRTVREV